MVLSKRSGRADIADALEKLALNDPPFLVSFDTEGTTRSGGIREIAACCVDRPSDTFSDIVTPRSKAEGLSESDAARTWSQVGPRFYEWLASRSDRPIVLVAHNAKHDVALLRRETLESCPQCVDPKIRFADTLAATRAMLPEAKRRDQASVYQHLFGSAPAKSHTALADAIANASVAKRLAEHLVRNTLPLFLPAIPE